MSIVKYPLFSAGALPLQRTPLRGAPLRKPVGLPPAGASPDKPYLRLVRPEEAVRFKPEAPVWRLPALFAETAVVTLFGILIPSDTERRRPVPGADDQRRLALEIERENLKSLELGHRNNGDEVPPWIRQRLAEIDMLLEGLAGTDDWLKYFHPPIRNSAVAKSEDSAGGGDLTAQVRTLAQGAAFAHDSPLFEGAIDRLYAVIDGIFDRRRQRGYRETFLPPVEDPSDDIAIAESVKYPGDAARPQGHHPPDLITELLHTLDTQDHYEAAYLILRYIAQYHRRLGEYENFFVQTMVVADRVLAKGRGLGRVSNEVHTRELLSDIRLDRVLRRIEYWPPYDMRSRALDPVIAEAYADPGMQRRGPFADEEFQTRGGVGIRHDLSRRFGLRANPLTDGFVQTETKYAGRRGHRKRMSFDHPPSMAEALNRDGAAVSDFTTPEGRLAATIFLDPALVGKTSGELGAVIDAARGRDATLGFLIDKLGLGDPQGVNRGANERLAEGLYQWMLWHGVRDPSQSRNRVIVREVVDVLQRFAIACGAPMRLTSWEGNLIHEGYWKGRVTRTLAMVEGRFDDPSNTDPISEDFLSGLAVSDPLFVALVRILRQDSNPEHFRPTRTELRVALSRQVWPFSDTALDDDYNKLVEWGKKFPDRFPVKKVMTATDQHRLYRPHEERMGWWVRGSWRARFIHSKEELLTWLSGQVPEAHAGVATADLPPPALWRTLHPLFGFVAHQILQEGDKYRPRPDQIVQRARGAGYAIDNAYVSRIIDAVMVLIQQCDIRLRPEEPVHRNGGRSLSPSFKLDAAFFDGAKEFMRLTGEEPFATRGVGVPRDAFGVPVSRALPGGDGTTAMAARMSDGSGAPVPDRSPLDWQRMADDVRNDLMGVDPKKVLTGIATLRSMLFNGGVDRLWDPSSLFTAFQSLMRHNDSRVRGTAIGVLKDALGLHSRVFSVVDGLADSLEVLRDQVMVNFERRRTRQKWKDRHLEPDLASFSLLIHYGHLAAVDIETLVSDALHIIRHPKNNGSRTRAVHALGSFIERSALAAAQLLQVVAVFEELLDPAHSDVAHHVMHVVPTLMGGGADLTGIRDRLRRYMENATTLHHLEHAAAAISFLDGYFPNESPSPPALNIPQLIPDP